MAVLASGGPDHARYGVHTIRDDNKDNPMSYQKLEQHQQQLHRLSHLSAICGWDQAAMMPEGGNEARAEAMAELGVLIHGKRTAPELGEWIAKAESEPLDEHQRANLREIKRQWQDASLLPGALVEARSPAANASTPGVASARRTTGQVLPRTSRRWCACRGRWRPARRRARGAPL
jgi:carboxypeptidase Taq